MIEDLRYLLQSAPAMYLAQVIQISDLDEEQTEYLVRCKLLPDKGEVVAHATYSLGGGQEKAQANDVVLVAFPGNDAEYAVVVTILSNDARLLHPRTDNGDVVIVSRPGMKTNIVSDTRVNIGKGGETEEAEALVLGNVLSSYLTQLVSRLDTACSQISTAANALKSAFDAIKTGPVADTCAPGSPVATGAAIITAMTTASTAMNSFKTAVDNIKTGLGDDKTTYLTDAESNILSQIAFTERGASE